MVNDVRPLVRESPHRPGDHICGRGRERKVVRLDLSKDRQLSLD